MRVDPQKKGCVKPSQGWVKLFQHNYVEGLNTRVMKNPDFRITACESDRYEATAIMRWWKSPLQGDFLPKCSNSLTQLQHLGFFWYQIELISIWWLGSSSMKNMILKIFQTNGKWIIVKLILLNKSVLSFIQTRLISNWTCFNLMTWFFVCEEHGV